MPDLTAKPIWWLPTLGFFIFIAVELGMFWAPDLPFGDPGAGRHLRTAEYILESHQIPRTDPLSYTHGGEFWLDYEWAFEATIGELDRAGGLGLVGAFSTAIFAATCLGIYRTLLQSGFSFSVVLIVLVMAFLTLHQHLAARPVLFSYLFMALVVEVWQRRAQPLRRDWILLPIIFIAWANIHAGWAGAFAFLVLAVIGRVFDRWRGRVDGEEAPIIPWIGLIGLLFLATLVNPWGFTLHRRIFAYATSYKSFALWDEYAQPNFNGPGMTALTVLFVLVIVLFSRAVRRAPVWRWEMILPVAFFLYEGLKAQRHTLLLMEVAAVPLARDLQVLLHGTWWPIIRSQLGQFQDRQREEAGGDAVLCFIAALIFTAVFVHSPAAQQIKVGRSITPGLVDFIRKNPEHFQRPLNTTWNGGPLLWRLRPGFKVSFDDRGDFYGDTVTFAFINLYNGSTDWRKNLDQGHFDSLILDNYLNLVQLVGFLPDWKKVYYDDKTTVFWYEPVPAVPPAAGAVPVAPQPAAPSSPSTSSAK